MSRRNKLKVRDKPKISVKNSGYSGGGASLSKKTLKSWFPSHYSAKSDIDANLSTLRDRAADLAINSPIGAAAIKTQVTGVINAGLKLFPRINGEVLGLSDDEAREWNRKTKREFELWANDFNCDFYGRNNFFELQRIAYTNELVDGDCFSVFRRRVPRGDNPYTLKLQLIEAARVSNPLGAGRGIVGGVPTIIEMEGKTKGSRIVNGIEVDRNGTIQAVWISNRVWNEPFALNPELKWQRVKVFGDNSGTRNILHLCFDTRIEQFRGEPYLAPVIETLKQVSRYGDAELTSAIIKSFFSIFFVQPESNFDIYQIAGDEKPDITAPCLDVTDYKLGSGTMSALPRGVDVKSIDSNNAQSTFESFTNQFVQQIGAALGVPSEVIQKSFKASYSASKAALLQAADEFRQRRESFINDFCQPVYENFLAEAVALGRIDAPKFFDDPVLRREWCKANWHNETSHLLDPTKEVQASLLKIQSGLSTYSKESAEICGTDYEENLRQLAIEKKLRENLGLNEGATVYNENSNENFDSDSDEEGENENVQQDLSRRLP